MIEDQNPESSRTFLVGIHTEGAHAAWTIEDSLGELAALAETAGLTVEGTIFQNLPKAVGRTLVGPGKLTEAVAMAEEAGCSTVIFDDELSPGQQKNLEEAFGEGVKVLDRTTLILDIFARHARTREGQLQVELAQYEYRLPRLTHRWVNLMQQTGGKAGGSAGVGLRGPGETQLEMDRRQIRKRISHLKKEIEEVRKSRGRLSDERRSQGMQSVAIAGYTNAGKSTLLNRLSDSDVLVEDKLFATLDPTTRRVKLPSGRMVLFTDTVGFIKKLPHNLVAAFRATFEGIGQADLVVHVADASQRHAEEQVRTVDQVLTRELDLQVPVLLVWNKADLLTPDLSEAMKFGSGGPSISALRGQGIDALLVRIEEMLCRDFVSADFVLPYDRWDILHLIRERARVISEEHLEAGARIRADMPQSLAGLLRERGIGV